MTTDNRRWDWNEEKIQGKTTTDSVATAVNIICSAGSGREGERKIKLLPPRIHRGVKKKTNLNSKASSDSPVCCHSSQTPDAAN